MVIISFFPFNTNCRGDFYPETRVLFARLLNKAVVGVPSNYVSRRVVYNHQKVNVGQKTLVISYSKIQFN